MSNDGLNHATINGNGAIEHPALSHDDLLGQGATTSIERAIEQIGEHYISDLRMLSEQFSRFYETQLAAKDNQIESLRERLTATERDRDRLAEQLSALRSACVKLVADLQQAGDQLSHELEPTAHASAATQIGG